MNKWISVPTIAKYEPDKPPMPLRIRVSIDGSDKTITIDRIISHELLCASGEAYYRYVCRSVVGNRIFQFQMQYWIATYLWQFRYDI